MNLLCTEGTPGRFRYVLEVGHSFHLEEWSVSLIMYPFGGGGLLNNEVGSPLLLLLQAYRASQLWRLPFLAFEHLCYFRASCWIALSFWQSFSVPWPNFWALWLDQAVRVPLETGRHFGKPVKRVSDHRFRGAEELHPTVTGKVP